MYFLGRVDVFLNSEMFNWYNARYRRMYPAASSASLLLGQHSNQVDISKGVKRRFRAFQGTISHFILYDRPITHAEVKEAYRKTPTYAGAIASWDLWKSTAKGYSIREVNYDGGEPF